MCLWISTGQSYTEIWFSAQTDEDQSLCEGKHSPVLLEPNGYTENIYNIEKVPFC